jgi:hypothetical protein
VTPDAAASALEDELDALYAVPLQEFIARRDALAKRLKLAGAAEESRRVKALRKPNTVAWAINRLHLLERGLSGVEAAGDALRIAIATAGSAPERRAAIDARRRAVEQAVDATARILAEGGTSSTPDLLRRIERTLLAIAAAPSGGSTPPPGRLDADLEPPGFEALAGLPLAGPAAAGHADRAQTRVRDEERPSAAGGRTSGTAGATKAKRGATATKGKPGAGASAAAPAPRAVPAPRRPGVRDLQRERAIRGAQAALDEADGELERTTAVVEVARSRVDDAERALREARAALDVARGELNQARLRRDALRRELERVRNPGRDQATDPASAPDRNRR